MNGIVSIRILKRISGGFGVLTFASLALSFSVPAHAARCSFESGHGTANMSFSLPKNLQVPRDAPAGTIIWESTFARFGGGNNFTCNNLYSWGAINSVGASASASSEADFPIGKTGLAWGLVHGDVRVSSTSDLPDIAFGLYNGSGGYSFGYVRFKLRIKKIGSVVAGASVPSGLLGKVNINNELDAFLVNANNEAAVSTVSCKTPAVTVRMGDENRVSQFKGVGTSIAPVNFSVGLKECPEGISKVSYLLKPNTEVVDAGRSVIALDGASSAKGISLQILDEGGNPVALNKTIVFNGYDKAGGDFNIPLKAAYHQTAEVVEPGTANSSVTLVMSYD
ncbi:type 1 fimbrial protein [Ralstonia sp. CHL-2022]|uniref:Type 1 fimbrial protein n=1 Tax=Ralstonia mojiangensis TaxID=2953895 RepID=A0ABT2L3F2_9RALS|nr:fimbrial protein [Ralstonia mojiangensis]MCT7297389.1 type 1 fimbrial protein [Ralstonia mojiangensis]MCT7309950.1 type 1 fimbrial protein [Ralstonia mojiangensis]